MPTDIDISLSAGSVSPVEIEVGYSGPSVEITLTQPAAQNITIELGNIGPQGEPGQDGVGLSDLVLNEVPTGDIDGVNFTFTTAFAFDSISVYLNGLKLNPEHFSTSGLNILIDDPPLTGDLVTVDYVKS
jgi:hypothetical protein